MELALKVMNDGKKVFKGTFPNFPVTFGKADHCNLCLPMFGFLARVHGVISYSDGLLQVTDLSSDTGMKANNGEAFIRAKFERAGSFAVNDLIFYFELVEPGGGARELVSKSGAAGADTGSNSQRSSRAVPISSKRSKPVDPEATVKDEDLPEDPKSEITSVTALVRQEFLPDPRPKKDRIVVETALIWGNDILEVQQFRPGEVIWISGDPESPVYLPGLKKPLVIGKAQRDLCSVRIPTNMQWHLVQDGLDISTSVDTSKKTSSGRTAFNMKRGQQFSCELGNDVRVQLRFVEASRFFIKRNWIENREEFIRAFKISVLIHLIISSGFLLSAPKIEAPVIKNVPARFAKLIVQPPQTPLAAPQAPTPTPVPVAEQPAPKPEPKPPTNSIVKKTPTKKRPVTKPVAQKQPVSAPVTEPESSAEDQAAADLMAALSGPGPKSIDTKKGIKIDDATDSSPAASQRFSTNEISGSLKAKGGKLTGGIGVATGQAGPKVGDLGYSKSAGGNAGKRGVLGQVVGAPSLEDFSNAENGLTEQQVMAEVNKHLSKIQRCYERSLLNDATTAGRVQYGWEIDPSGKVGQVRVQRSEVARGDELNSCVIGIIKSMRFPTAKTKKSTTASLSFAFGKDG